MDREKKGAHLHRGVYGVQILTPKPQYMREKYFSQKIDFGKICIFQRSHAHIQRRLPACVFDQIKKIALIVDSSMESEGDRLLQGH